MKPYMEYIPTDMPWLPSIPAHWDVRRAKRMYQKENRPVREHDDVITCFRDGVVTLRKNRRTEGFTESIKEIGYQGIRKGDLVIHVMDAFAGSTGVSDSDGKSSPVYSVCTALGDLNNHYYAHVIRVMAKSGFIQSLYRGIRERSSDFRFEVFAALDLPLPPRSEQDQIVRYLDHQSSKINALIAAKRREIGLIEEIKQKIIDDFVLSGTKDTIITGNVDDRWDIAYPAGWELRRMRELFAFKKGLTITKEDLVDEGVPVISYGQIHSKMNTGAGLNDKLIRYVDPAYLESNPKSLVQQGDFIFADTSEDYAGCGNCVYVDWDTTIFAGSHSIIARPTSSEISRYFAYLFKSSQWRTQLRQKVNGVKVFSVTQNILKDMMVLIPPAAEQAAIVAKIQDKIANADTAINNIERQIDLLHELRTRLISDVVTGQVDVRGVSVPEFETIEETVPEADEITDEDETEE